MKQKIKVIPLVDNWKPTGEDNLFTHAKNIILAPLDQYYNLEGANANKINFFMINSKKSYNSDKSRIHLCHYINYFEKFYDVDKEYFTNLAQMKFLIDVYPEYNKDNFINDIVRYIIQPSMFAKIDAMVERNYSLELNYKSNNNPQLQYTDEHAKTLMKMSIMMNLCIPLITHFAYMRRLNEIDDFILDVYDFILYAEPFRSVDINSKLYETTISNVNRNARNNVVMWQKQDIRGKDTITHSMDGVKNIIINIMPKYMFSENIISLNYTSVQKNNKYQITDIAYEYSYIPLSSSKRDGEDNTSEFDKYEANMIKTSEMLYLQSKVNYQFVMESLIEQWGPFDKDEIKFYTQRLKNDNNEIVNMFQKQLIFNLFYKHFGDTNSIRGINNEEYVELMLIAKRMLENNMMLYLPYVISGKVQKVVSRKSLNKKELQEMQNSPYYQLVVDKYKNDKILKQIFGTMATIITSTFNIIDYKDPNLDGQQIVVESHILIHEFLLYTLLI